MALAIAHKIREQQNFEEIKTEPKDEDEVEREEQVERFTGFGKG